jgi:hypothetical protein
MPFVTALFVYVKRDVCECGHGVLRDDVPLGKEYWIDRHSIGPGKFHCGGCGKTTPVTMGQVIQHGAWSGWIVMEILEAKENADAKAVAANESAAKKSR